ncbi:MAG TPA: YezD family protein, partial [Croceibacterium sp.]|nr:YezD family protein [Croceibacterium sp.]
RPTAMIAVASRRRPMGATVERVNQIDPAELPEHLRVVAEALERLRYGVVQLTVHDGKLMQVDVTERRRFA